MTKQALKLGSRILENLPEMDRESMQGWINSPRKLRAFLEGLARSKQDNEFLVLHDSFAIGRTAGCIVTENYSGLEEAGKKLSDWINSRETFDSDEKRTETEDAGKTDIAVFAGKRPGNYVKFLCSLGNIYQLALSQSQLREFCRRLSAKKLPQPGFAFPCFFVLCKAGSQLFIARTKTCEGGSVTIQVTLFGHDVTKYDNLHHLFVVKDIGI